MWVLYTFKLWQGLSSHLDFVNRAWTQKVRMISPNNLFLYFSAWESYNITFILHSRLKLDTQYQTTETLPKASISAEWRQHIQI